MKRLNVVDALGPVAGWSFGYQKALHIGVGKPRMIAGWVIRSPDGVERFSEGNWQQFVPFAIRVVENYGAKTTLS